MYFPQYQKIFVIPHKIRNRIDIHPKFFVGNVALIIWLARHDNKIEKHKL